ncbi:CARDB domain-containing protein [Hyalangium versicolor]|uniref:CARDB domain-containing protein n=1 Tax=Hyalangium versicolor TaxID=2861190 RepID=UPI001CCD4191|nr:CARDB domain-containing protein [Hyalangium versicolor]
MPQASNGRIRGILGVVVLMAAAGCGNSNSSPGAPRSTARQAETAAADFMVAAVTEPITAHPGNSLASEVTVCNQGLGSGSTQVALFLTSDPASPMPPPPDSTTTLLLKSANTELLQPGQCQTLAMSGPSTGQENGEYHLAAVADPDHSQPESDEDNNARFSNPFVISEMADLVVTKVTGPVSATMGQQITTHVTMCNRGTDWGTWAWMWVAVYLSPTPTVSLPVPPTAVFLGASNLYHSYPALCEELAISGPVSVDTAGPWFLVAVADKDNTQPELFEDNNVLVSSRPIGVGLLPDFVVTAVTAPPSARSGPFAASVTVCNQGTQGGSTQVEVHGTRVQDSSSPAPTLSLGTVSTDFLSPGQCQTQPVSTWLRTVTGTYTLEAVADPGHTTPELIEDNNSKQGDRFSLGLRPDFVVAAVSGPPSVLPGDSFTASVTVCNQGTQSGSTSVSAYLSTDEVITPHAQTPPPFGVDRRVGTQPTDVLAPGRCQALSIQSSALGPTGVSYLGAVVDPDQSTPELSEDNNARTGHRISLGLRPDFVVTAVIGPENLISSVATFDTKVTVCNQGTVGGNTLVSVYKSWGEHLSVADPNVNWIGQATWAGDLYSRYLWPGECETQLVHCSFSGEDGLYFLGAIADPDRTTPELLEDNNSFTAGHLSTFWGPDFVVTQVTGPASVLPGQPFTAQVSVCNRGSFHGTTQVDLLLSSDNLLMSPEPFLPEAQGVIAGSSAQLPLEEDECQTIAVPSVASVPAAGAYFLQAVAHPDPNGWEKRQDNSAKVGSRIGIGQGPDFVVTQVSGPASTAPGAFTASVRVCNQGTVAGVSQIDLYVSPDQQTLPPVPGLSPLAQGRLVGSMSSGSLAPGACQTLPVQGQSGGAEGAFYLGAVASADGLGPPELIPDNNALIGSRMGIGWQPDFVVTAVSGPPSVLQGGQLTATATVCNQGTVAGSTRVDLFVSPDTRVSQPVSSLPPRDRDLLLGTGNTDPLSPGQCQAVSVSGAAAMPTDGAYYLGAVANLDLRPELIRDNDSLVGSRIGIGSAPDFVVTAVTGPASLPPDASLTAAVSVCNQGTLARSASVTLILSEDDIVEGLYSSLPWEPQDFYMGDGNTAVLEPGQCQPLEIQGHLWDATPGGFLGAFVYSDQPELIKDNNGKIGTPITVTF